MSEHNWIPRSLGFCHHWEIQVDQHHSVSVIDNGYGGEFGAYECAILRNGRLLTGDSNPKYEDWNYDDVCGWMTEDDVEALVEELEAIEVWPHA